MFGVSSLGTVSVEELRKRYDTPQVYQFYFHKDLGLNRAMMERAKTAGVNAMMLTVDSITGGTARRPGAYERGRRRRASTKCVLIRATASAGLSV